MATPSHILVICHANVARSVAAAHLLRRAVDERGVEIDLTTAGTHATVGQPVSSRTVTSLGALLGEPVDLGTHRARQVSDDDLQVADLIVTMEASQVRMIRRRHTAAADRMATLALLARELPKDARVLAVRVASMALARREPDDADDVIDPAGGGDAEYTASMSALITLCGELGVRLAG
jgi:protein-tyrosine-phosphatase